MLKINNDALRESEELNKPIHFNREDFKTTLCRSSKGKQRRYCKMQNRI